MPDVCTLQQELELPAVVDPRREEPRGGKGEGRGEGGGAAGGSSEEGTVGGSEGTGGNRRGDVRSGRRGGGQAEGGPNPLRMYSRTYLDGIALEREHQEVRLRIGLDDLQVELRR